MAAETKPKKSLSVLKRVRQNKKRNTRNRAVKGTIRTLTKKLEKAIGQNSKEETGQYLKEVIKVLSVAKSKGMLHPNTSSRKISRLSKKAAPVLKAENA